MVAAEEERRRRRKQKKNSENSSLMFEIIIWVRFKSLKYSYCNHDKALIKRLLVGNNCFTTSDRGNVQV